MSSLSLKDNQLEEIAEHFLNAVLKSNPTAQARVQNNPNQRNELRALLVNTMKQLQQQRSESLTPNGLVNPQHANHLMAALSLALNLNLKLNKNLEKALATQLHKNPKLLLQLEKVLSQAGLLDPKMQEMIKGLKDLQMSKSPTLKPGGNKSTKSDKDKEENKEQELDPYIALLGLISSKQSGGIAAVVQCFLGNVLGIVDQNPNMTNDARDPQIARNREAVTSYDDLGITERIRESYESIPGTLESLLEEIMSPDAHRWMHEQLHALHNRPHLSH
jgi:hypothetical protein